MPNKTQKHADFLYKKESYLIRGACFTVYRNFRSTQKESVYQKSFAIKLKNKGLEVEREKQLPVYYENERVGVYIPDILVNKAIIIELKAKPFLHPDDIKQFWYYLKNSEFKLGLLINFGNPNKVEITRRVYDTARLPRSSASESKSVSICVNKK